MLLRRNYILLLLIFGCKSIFTAELNEATKKKIIKEFAEVSDLFILSNLVIEYHEQNKNWPKNLEVISFSEDSLILFLKNFDTLKIDSDTIYFQIWYKFSESREITLPIEFIRKEDTANIITNRKWFSMDNAKYINHIFDGRLQITLKNEEYQINKEPSIDKHSR
jgi:hypothetical protein